MTTQTLQRTSTNDQQYQPIAEDLAKAQVIVTGPTVIVCGLVTFMLFVVLNVVGLAIGLIITGVVLLQNASVRRMSIQNAIDDRLEREAQR